MAVSNHNNVYLKPIGFPSVFINTSCLQQCMMIRWSSGKAPKFVNLKVDGSNPPLGNTSTIDVIFITPCSSMVFCKSFYFYGSHFSAEPENSEYQIFYFLTLSAERSKFLERTLSWGIFYMTYKAMPQLWWSVWARRNWAALPHESNGSKIGHSYETFTYQFGLNISTPLVLQVKSPLLIFWI